MINACLLLSKLVLLVSIIEKVSSKDLNNVIISPFLLEEGLKQLYLGAEGKTAEELKTAIKFLNSKSDVDIAKDLNEDHSKLQLNDGLTLKFGNELFVAADINLLPAFEQKIKQTFNTSVNPVNFGDSGESVAIINDWVAKQTDNKITRIVEETSPDTKIMLVSAIYFNGKWKYPFDMAKTRKGPFYALGKNGSEPTAVEVEMMLTDEVYRLNFLEDLDATAISLPYANSNISMVIILPREIIPLDGLVDKLDEIDIHEIVRNSVEQQIFIRLPKFKFEFEIDMKPVLKSLGVQDLFTSANLRSMTDYAPQLFVSEVLQKGYIEVDEEGTTAAAAESIGIMQISVPLKIDVDRPFVFYIVDENQIYFNGEVYYPHREDFD